MRSFVTAPQYVNPEVRPWCGGPCGRFTLVVPGLLVATSVLVGSVDVSGPGVARISFMGRPGLWSDLAGVVTKRTAFSVLSDTEVAGCLFRFFSDLLESLAPKVGSKEVLAWVVGKVAVCSSIIPHARPRWVLVTRRRQTLHLEGADRSSNMALGMSGNELKLWIITELSNRKIVADSSRYNLLVPRLSRPMLIAAQSVLLNPPRRGKYEALKALVLKEAEPSNTAKLEELLRPIQLGDRKPSVLLREMQSSGSTYGVSDTLLQELWLRRLPEAVQALLAASSAKSLTEMAATADSVLDRIPSLRHGTLAPVLTPQPSTSYSTSQHSDQSPHVDHRDLVINALRQELQNARISNSSVSREEFADAMLSLKREIAERRSRSSSRSSGRSVSRFSDRSSNSSLSRSGSRGDSARQFRARTPDPSLCWYHNEFADRARNCREPCTRFGEFQARQGNR
ncbi:hypothetical protein B566_EDAN019186 [Ephemera danica]|nr:hypothetical protein B566_EDAN019186 [Ephemera danica]